MVCQWLGGIFEAQSNLSDTQYANQSVARWNWTMVCESADCQWRGLPGYKYCAKPAGPGPAGLPDSAVRPGEECRRPPLPPAQLKPNCSSFLQSPRPPTASGSGDSDSDVHEPPGTRSGATGRPPARLGLIISDSANWPPAGGEAGAFQWGPRGRTVTVALRVFPGRAAGCH